MTQSEWFEHFTLSKGILGNVGTDSVEVEAVEADETRLGTVGFLKLIK